MSLRCVLADVCVLVSFAVVGAAGQNSGVAISGPSPWVDVTAPPYRAACDGVTDDTAAIQVALNALSPAAGAQGGTLFIPPTSKGCQIHGYSVTITAASIPSGTTLCTGTPPNEYCQVTVKLSRAPPSNTFVAQQSLVNIHNVGNGSSTIFNGTYLIQVEGHVSGTTGDCVAGTGTPACIGYVIAASGPDTASSTTNGVAEIGLYYNGNNLKIVGAGAAPGTTSSSGSMVSMLTNCNSCTTPNITILTTMTNAGPHIGPDIQNVTFYDKSGGGTGGSAYGGLRIGNTNGFNISNDGFYGFYGSATLTTNFQAGAAIVLTGGQGSSSTQANPWVQYGKLENNHINAKIGVTSEFNVSSVTFDSNSVDCLSQTESPPYPTTGTIGLDIGGLWYLNNGMTLAVSTGGENRLINQQTQDCLIGVLFGSQDNDLAEEKLENGTPYNGTTGVKQCASSPQPPYCPIGLAVLNTQDSTFFGQAKKIASGIYIDSNSPHNRIYENTTQITTASNGIASGATLNTLCPPASSCPAASYSFGNASLVLDPAVFAGTSIFGTPSGGPFAPTSNSTFTTDNDPAGLQLSQQTAASSTTSYPGPPVIDNATFWYNPEFDTTSPPVAAASATDCWALQDVVGNGSNGASTLTLTHNGTAPGCSGSPNTAELSVPYEANYGLTSTALGTPSGVSCTSEGTTGSTQYNYKIVAYVGPNATPASVAATCSNGNSTLSTTNWNKITWSSLSGADYYQVYRTYSVGSPSSTGGICKIPTGATLECDDKGLTGDGTTPSSTNTTGAANVANVIDTSTTQYGVLYGGGSSAAIGSTTAGATNTVLLGEGSGSPPQFGQVPGAAFFQSTPSNRTTATSFTSGSVLAYSVYITNPGPYNNIAFGITTADNNSSDDYDFGLYGAGCLGGASSVPLALHIGATPGSTWGSSPGVKMQALSGAPITLTSGWYCFAWTGNANTLKIGNDNGAIYVGMFSSGTSIGSYSSGLPSTVTAPATSPTTTAQVWFELY
jgi:hypothetical protein